jgi:uncharacterized protein (TIGR04255 family)
MPFPESRRVIYDKNPLVEVISQLRFPTVLTIEAQLPAQFQERLRGDYPIFDDGSASGTSELIPQEIARLFGSQFGISAAKVFAFISSDGVWKVHLNREFVAITCTKYRKWDDFRSRFLSVLEHLDEVYSPSFYTRVGLRYRNVIDRENLGLSEVQWGELFHPHLAAEFASDLADSVLQNQHQLLVELPNKEGRVRIVHGIVQQPQKREPVYVIDNDFFTEERVEKSDAAKKLDTFNKHSGGLFRSFIKDKLDRAMGPIAVA